MRVLVLDDEHAVCNALRVIVSALGHEVEGYVDPLSALEAVTPDLDLVISDVTMPGLDGFGFARQVTEKLGCNVPRVLLVSGGLHTVRLLATAPSRVIGIIYKPFHIRDLRRIMAFIEGTRARCPGCCEPFRDCCREYLAGSGQEAPRGHGVLCATDRYAVCPLYDKAVGPAVRGWVVAGDGTCASSQWPQASA